MVIGLDIGFGWTKFYADGTRGKFPTWIGVWTPQLMSDVEPVVYGAESYVVGWDAENYSKIEVTDYESLLRFMPVVAEKILKSSGFKKERARLVSGLPPSYYVRFRSDESPFARKVKEYFDLVLYQGLGVLVDVEDQLKFGVGEKILLLDVGYNTTDYLYVEFDGEVYRKIATGSIEGSGVKLAVEFFRGKLPEELRWALASHSASSIMPAFDSGEIKIMGKTYSLKQYVKESVQLYRASLEARVQERLRDFIFSADRFIVAGGGASLVGPVIREDCFVPQEPEFSNARGYVKYYLKEGYEQ